MSQEEILIILLPHSITTIAPVTSGSGMFQFGYWRTLQQWCMDLSQSWYILILPDSFLSGSAPRLRFLELDHIPFPGLPKLLSAKDVLGSPLPVTVSLPGTFHLKRWGRYMYEKNVHTSAFISRKKSSLVPWYACSKKKLKMIIHENRSMEDARWSELTNYAIQSYLGLIVTCNLLTYLYKKTWKKRQKVLLVDSIIIVPCSPSTTN